MAIPLVADIYSGVRSVLGDTKTAAGEVFVDSLLAPHFQTAYAELFRTLQAASSPLIEQDAYFDVPAFTGYLKPSTIGITSLGNIQSIFERGNITSWAISAVTPGAGICTVISAPTSLITGNQAVIFGVNGISVDINDVWTVTVNSTVSTQLNGCAATGTYTSGGTLSFSAEKFLEMIPQTDIDWSNQAPTNAFQVYAFEKGIIRVPPCNAVRQIKVVYRMSGEAPLVTTASVGIDDSLDFLKYRVAGMVGPSKGMLQRAQIYTRLAVGANWETMQVPGGILSQLVMNGVRNLQRLPPLLRRPPAWRDHRRRLVW
jgi:hypothetical protein